MNKEEFLAQLRSGLSALPLADTEERIAFYDEMINDRMEEGLSEEEAVRGVGAVDEIVKGALSDTSLSKLVREKVKPRRALRPWEIVLLAVGSPLWLALLIAAAAVLFSLYIVLWAVIVSLWALAISFVAALLGGFVLGVAFFLRGSAPAALGMLGCGMLCGGVSIFLFFGSMAATKRILHLTAKTVLRIKTGLVKKEAAQ